MFIVNFIFINNKNINNRAFLTPLFVLIKTLCDIWPLQWKIGHIPEQLLTKYFTLWLKV